MDKDVYTVKLSENWCYLYCGKIFIFAGTKQQVEDYLDWLENHKRAA